MNEPTLFGIVIVPAIIGLVQAAKDAGLPSHFAPLLAVLFGITAGIAQLEAGHLSWIPAVILGISFGLTACGLYAGATTVISYNPSRSAKTDPPVSKTDPQVSS